MDEQHSRSQRKFGSAPYCTATFLNAQGLIFLMHSVDQGDVDISNVVTKAGSPAKSKAKVAHCEGMQQVVELFSDGPSLRHFCTDQSSDGQSDAEKYFRPAWNDFHMNFDIWHKVKEFDGLWKAFCSKREYSRGMFCLIDSLFSYSHTLGPFMHKELQYLFTKNLLPAHSFKVHFEYCCGSCEAETVQARVEKFQELWLGAADHYAAKWKDTWMKDYLKELKGM
jgi:hypothetical protein